MSEPSSSFPASESLSSSIPATAGSPEDRGLSDIARLVDTLIAPSRTFTDIRRSSRWWLPFLVAVALTYIFAYAVQRQVGWMQVFENQIKLSPKAQEQFAALEPAQVSEKKQQAATFTQYSFFAAPLFSLLFAAIAAAVLLATVNFGFGGEATFGRMFAVWMYGTLPLSLKGLLAAIVLFAGMDPEQFNLSNPVGTNLGFYLPSDMSKGLVKFATSLDVMTIWTVVLLVIGCSIIGNIKKSSAAIAVVGWWLLAVLAGTATAVIQG